MRFDYIIIGAGSAGCVLANRLTENTSCKVLLLEAGGKGTPLINIPGAYGTLHRSPVDWAFQTAPQIHVNNRKMFIPRGKVLGGCSSTNAMAYVRGNREDYNEWAALGNNGWSYEEVLPYFKKSEHHEQFSGPYHSNEGLLNVCFAQYPSSLDTIFLDACAEAGIHYNKDYNGEIQLGASMLQYTIKNNRRYSTATAFLKPARLRPNLTVRTHTLVKQIIIEKDMAVGVEIFKGYGITEKIYCNKEVILSAGAIKSPQLLLLSGIGDEQTLQKAAIDVKVPLTGVGKNLQDHLWTRVSNLSNIPTANNALKPLNMAKGLLDYIFFKKGPFCNSPIEANAFLKTEHGLNRPDIQFHFAPFQLGDDYKADPYNIKTIPLANGYTILVILLHPQSRGTITLNTNNAFDAPVIQPNFFESGSDKIVLLKGLKKAMEVMDAGSFRPYSPNGLHHPLRNATDEVLMDHICKSLETLYHPVGTCKMGKDPLAVVSDRLQVHGLKRLRVVDASIMPTIISGNTNAPSIMIGEKGADLIKEMND